MHERRRPSAVLAGLLAGLLSLCLLPVTAPVAAAGTAAVATGPATPLRDGHGIRVVSARQEDDRLLRLVVRTAALERPVRVNVLLPEGYADGRRRYPTLYLFHGTSGGADDWLERGEVRAATAGRPLITVLPDAGYDSNGGSWFTDWLDQETELGAARWETFHTRQLVRWVDDNFRTVARRSGRAIAGLSQGGFGAYSYAARHPDLFVAAGSFSGAPDIARHPAAKAGGSAVVSGIMVGLNGVQPFAPFGDPVADDIVWQGHNPATLVSNLAHTDLQLWCGTGQPGPYDEPGPDTPSAVAIEQFTYDSTTFFVEAARAEGVDHVFHDYGAGTHSWPYWARDLRQWLPHLEAVLAEDRPTPRQVSYRSIERTWRQWGWRVATRRAAEHAWSGLDRASADGFALSGGPAVVTTPSTYLPGRDYLVTYRDGSGPGLVTADDHGRLRLRVAPDSSEPVVVTVRAAA